MKKIPTTALVLASAALLTVSACETPDIPTFDGLPFNYHTVEAGKLYRSGQPGGDQLAVAVARDGIKTVVNLRGENTGKGWYDEEEAACGALGVKLVNIRTGSRALFPPEALRLLVETFETAEYPLLMHCDTGSDRTGAAGAIYLIMQGVDRGKAMEQLSPVYFHYQSLRPCMSVMAEIFQLDDAWLDWYAAHYDDLTCSP